MSCVDCQILDIYPAVEDPADISMHKLHISRLLEQGHEIGTKVLLQLSLVIGVLCHSEVEVLDEIESLLLLR